MRTLFVLALLALLATFALASESSQEVSVADEGLMELDSEALMFDSAEVESELDLEAEAETEVDAEEEMELEADKPKGKDKKPANKGKKSAHKKADPHSIPKEFIDWMKAHGKHYATPAERLKRFNIWKAAQDKIHGNKKIVQVSAVQGEDEEVKLTVNGPFSDLTEKEFEETYLKGVKLSSHSLLEQFNMLKNGQSVDDRREGEIFFETEADIQSLTAADIEALADATSESMMSSEQSAELEAASVSWKHISSGVKNQGQCGSCWAFAATEVLESAAAKAHKGLKNLSPQVLVDCDHNAAHGCNGGDPASALQYYQSKPSRSASHYRYTARHGSCKSRGPAGPKVATTGFACGGSCRGKESTMLSELRKYGPMVIIVNANHAWQYYKGGVMSPSHCSSSGSAGNHAVVVVGYSSKGYWIVRNSWGTRWGEHGYIRLRYGHNTCGMANYVVWATA